METFIKIDSRHYTTDDNRRRSFATRRINTRFILEYFEIQGPQILDKNDKPVLDDLNNYTYEAWTRYRLAFLADSHIEIAEGEKIEHQTYRLEYDVRMTIQDFEALLAAAGCTTIECATKPEKE